MVGKLLEVDRVNGAGWANRIRLPPVAGVNRAEELLDQLDRIRVGILTGGISGATLQNIVNRLAKRRSDGVEPRLAALIDEIELRARVELAKLSIN